VPSADRSNLIGRLVARGAWGAMLLIHVPILAAVMAAVLADPTGGERIASAAGLLVVTVLFLLKTLDVAWLRIGSARHSLLILLLAAAVVHHEALGTDPVTAPMTVVAAATGFEFARRSPQILRGLRTLLGTGRLSPPAVTAFVMTRDADCASLLNIGSVRTRGPPARGA